ncbi:MAG: glutathione S-transferase family protein [Pseudomonadota bacterium]
MKLYTAKIAPNPLRVEYFLKEKGIFDEVELVQVELATEAKEPSHQKRHIFGRVPVLELDDGQMLSESRAICTYLEELYPEPNLMGKNGVERAFIEMHDRQVELHVFFPIANWIRHSHPGLATLEIPQCPDWAASSEATARKNTAIIDVELGKKPYVAGDNFTIADITLYCALNFARLGRFKAWEVHANIAIWREKNLERPAFS